MEVLQAKWFEAEFCCVLEPVLNQKIHTARDYKIIELRESTPLEDDVLGAYIEFKFDKSARKTGNLYLEYQQTFNYGHSYMPSGVTLACTQSRFIVFSVPYATRLDHYVFASSDMVEILQRKLRSVRTRHCINGNRPGAWSNGFLLPAKSVPSFKRTERILAHT